jgi:Cu2+-containing amine oxidase
MSEAGTVDWPSTTTGVWWHFDWRLADSPDEEGIVITSAHYKGHKVFYKASLPSLRVQYSGPCGPYKDPLNYNNSQPTQRCPNSRVCMYNYHTSGLAMLVVESYHLIGAYRLTHRWIFQQNGVVQARLYSAGLQCNYDHRHHAYWRLDFDIDSSARNLGLEYNNYQGDVGWGPGWLPLTNEVTRTKNPSSRRVWAVLNLDSRRGYQIVPGINDGAADAFSTSDFWLLRYYSLEDKYGRQGNAAADGLGAYLGTEDVNGQDLVVWYCGHLAHRAAHGGDDWHEVGPTLHPFGRWT